MSVAVSPAAFRAVTVTTVVPTGTAKPGTDHRSLPMAVPEAPRSVAHVTSAMPEVWRAVPAKVIVASPVVNSSTADGAEMTTTVGLGLSRIESAGFAGSRGVVLGAGASGLDAGRAGSVPVEGVAGRGVAAGLAAAARSARDDRAAWPAAVAVGGAIEAGGAGDAVRCCAVRCGVACCGAVCGAAVCGEAAGIGTSASTLAGVFVAACALSVRRGNRLAAGSKPLGTLSEITRSASGGWAPVRITIKVAVPICPAASRAVTVMVFAPRASGTLDADQPVVPTATPFPPRSLVQATCVTPKASLALPLNARVAAPVV